MYKLFHLQTSLAYYLNIFTKEGIFKNIFFCLKFSSSGHSHVGSLFTDEEQKGGWLLLWLTLLPHMLALLMMSLAQAAGHKMAALTVAVPVVVVFTFKH